MIDRQISDPCGMSEAKKGDAQSSEEGPSPAVESDRPATEQRFGAQTVQCSIIDIVVILAIGLGDPSSQCSFNTALP